MEIQKLNTQLATKDLLLKPIALEDAEDYFVVLSDPETVLYWAHSALSDVSEVRKIIEEDIESDARGNSICWAIRQKDSPTVIGKCILFQFSHVARLLITGIF